MNAIQRQTLFYNTARALGGVAVHIQERHVGNCTKAYPEHGGRRRGCAQPDAFPEIGGLADRRRSA